LSRASISGPRMGTFFRRQSGARLRDHVSDMIGRRRVVNPRTAHDVFASEMKRSAEDKTKSKKKPGPREPGLRYWPREADTITFQEGLLNHRATGGGGHMRDATAQRSSTMILISAVRQPSEPHVSHAVSGPFIK